MDLGRVCERLMLAAHAHGIGSCIAGFGGDEQRAKAQALLGIPSTHHAPFAIAFGYPSPEQPQGARHGRLELADLVRYERF